MEESQLTKPIPHGPIFLNRQFDVEIILPCVRWYVTYKLSYRDLVADDVAERGVIVSHTTILRWVPHKLVLVTPLMVKDAGLTNDRSWPFSDTGLQINPGVLRLGLGHEVAQ